MAGYWTNIKQGISSLLGGLKLTFRHLYNARKRRNPVSIESQNYFDQQNGIVTTRYPHETLPVPDNGRYRLHNEVDDCIVCDLCAKICPVNCIEIEAIKAPEEIGKTSDGTTKRLYAGKFDIDMAKCCYCGLCTTVCPTECLTMTKTYDFSEFDIRDMIYHFTDLSPEEAQEKKDIFEESQRLKAELKKQKAAEAIDKHKGDTSETALKGKTPGPRPTGKPVIKPAIKPGNKEETKDDKSKPSSGKPVIKPKTKTSEPSPETKKGPKPVIKPVVKKNSQNQEEKAEPDQVSEPKKPVIKPVVKPAKKEGSGTAENKEKHSQKPVLKPVIKPRKEPGENKTEESGDVQKPASQKSTLKPVIKPATKKTETTDENKKSGSAKPVLKPVIKKTSDNKGKKSEGKVPENTEDLSEKTTPLTGNESSSDSDKKNTGQETENKTDESQKSQSKKTVLKPIIKPKKPNGDQK